MFFAHSYKDKGQRVTGNQSEIRALFSLHLYEDFRLTDVEAEGKKETEIKSIFHTFF